jgi:TPP-dependent pyruvate/acetoin dehydrogenase alpha subunit
MKLSKEEYMSIYKTMAEIRQFEERMGQLYSSGVIPGLAHPSIGQEAVAAGVCSALNREDYILSGHRGHGHSIAKGVPPKYLMAELLGKDGGVCRGIGGSMHSTYLEAGVLFSTAIVGGNIPIATGVGLAVKLRKEDKVVACFFGDGATNTGAFHEGINLAALWKVPAVFVCENNLYAISTHVSRSVSAKTIADRCMAYDIPGEIVDGNDVLAVREHTAKAVKRARDGEGPTLLECRTYRWLGHGMYDTGQTYRSVGEVDEWKRKCPIERFKKRILEDGVATKDELCTIEKNVKAIIEQSVEYAEASSFPSHELMRKILYV